MKTVLLLAFVAVAVTPLRAEEKPAKPAPLIRLDGASVYEGALIGSTQQSVTKFVDQVMTIIVDGKAVNVTKKVPVVETANVFVEYSLKNVKATTADGKEIAADELAAKVKDAKAVAVYPTGSKPTEKERKDFPKSTVFVELIEKK